MKTYICVTEENDVGVGLSPQEAYDNSDTVSPLNYCTFYEAVEVKVELSVKPVHAVAKKSCRKS